MKFLLIIVFVVSCFPSAAAQTKMLTSFDGVKIAYVIEGDGYPLLLLHGFINDGTMWDKSILKKELLAEGYQVIVPDLRGNGTSEKPQKDGDYADDAELKDLKLLLAKLGIHQIAAVGYSRGSIVLAKLMTQDKIIKKAVLGGMGIDFTNPNWDRRIQFAKAFEGNTNEMTRGAVAYATSIGADLRSLHLQQKFQPVTSIEALGKLTNKVLVISGDEDLDNGSPEELKNAIPNAILKIVPGNHNETYKTKDFSKEVIAFLKN